MNNTVKQTGIMEKTGIFDEDLKKRYELVMEYKGVKGKSILVIGINPASDTIQIADTTTNYLSNNLLTMGYSTITLCNLYANITNKLKPSEIEDNTDNMEYIKEVLTTKKFDHILIGFGNTFISNKKVDEQKALLYQILKPYAKKMVEITDSDGKYQELKTIHPLFAGQRFSGKWVLRKIEVPKETVKRRKEKEKE